MLNGSTRRVLSTGRANASVSLAIFFHLLRSVNGCFVFVSIKGRARSRKGRIYHRHVIIVLYDLDVRRFLIVDILSLGNGYYVLFDVYQGSIRLHRLLRRLRGAMGRHYARRFAIHLANEILQVGRLQQLKERTPVPMFVLRRGVILRFNLHRIICPTLRKQVTLFSKTVVTGLTMGRINCMGVNDQPDRIVVRSNPMAKECRESASVFVRKLFCVRRPLLVRRNVTRGRAFAVNANDTITRPSGAFVALKTINERATVISASSPVNVLIGSIGRLLKDLRHAIHYRFVVRRLANRVVHYQFVIRAKCFRGARAVMGGRQFPGGLAIDNEDVGVHSGNATRIIGVRFHAVILRRFNGARNGKLILLTARFRLLCSCRVLPRVRSVSSVACQFGKC